MSGSQAQSEATTQTHDRGAADALSLVRDLEPADVSGLLEVACAAADLELVAVTPRGLHERGRSVSRVCAATVRGPDGQRDVLFVVHGSSDAPPDGALVLERDGLAVSVWRFPYDPLLPGLPSAVSRQRVRELLDRLGAPAGEVELQTRAYRPTRRAVIEVRIASATGTGRVVFLKVLSADRARAIAATHMQLVGVVPVPRIIGVDEGLGILAMEALAGTTLRATLAAGEHAPPVSVIAALHTAIADSGLTSTAEPRRFADPRRHVPVLSRHVPERAPDIAAAAEVAATIDGPVVPVHGDLHDGQLLIAGGRIVGLLDVDGAGDGLIANDAANLITHLEALGDDVSHAAAYARDLADEVTPLVGADTLRRARIGAWLALATGPSRAQVPDAARITRRRVDRALDLA
ncbi:MAG: phosphotransferase [Nitriliruptoraceae bacterium]